MNTIVDVEQRDDSVICIVTFECPMCGKQHSMLIEESEIERFYKERSEGKHIQDIFPSMSALDREKFITGYCDECQKMIFGSDN